MTDQPRTAAGRALLRTPPCGEGQRGDFGADLYELRTAILAIEAEAAAAAPLDVDLLELAIQSADGRYTNRARVERVAAEYARLASADEEGDPNHPVDRIGWPR